MKFTLSWLNDHLATKATLDDILALMLKAGLEVEEVEDPRDKLSAFSVCKVKAAEPHPDADKLRVCTVDTVDGEKQIVCGAPNARAGMTAIYAPLGAYIPGLEFALDKKPRKIRGIESHGMMCSTRELEAGEDDDGIADLDDGIPLGTPAADALGLDDPVIDFEVTPNRPDWLGVQGIARDLAAAGAGRFLHADVRKVVGSGDCPVDIRLDAPDACPVFAGAVIVGVKNGPSPDWMQQRLKAVGIQPKSLLVDVTNYISLDRARPLHAYDAAKLSGTVVARLGRKGEKLEALDQIPSNGISVIRTPIPAGNSRDFGYGDTEVIGYDYNITFTRNNGDLHPLDWGIWRAIEIQLHKQEKNFPDAYVESVDRCKARLRQVAKKT